MKVTERTLADYKFDPDNAREHNPRNLGMIEDSLSRNGAGRSLVANGDDVIVCGNGTLEAAAFAGIDRVIEIETDGHALIVHKRSDLTPTQAVDLALADNRAAELASWKPQTLVNLQATAPEILGKLWTDAEKAGIFDAAALMPATPTEAPAQAAGPAHMTTLSFTLTEDQAAHVREALRVAQGEAEGADVTGNPSISGNALDVIVGAYLALQAVTVQS